MNERNTKWNICRAAMLSGLFLITGVGAAYAQNVIVDADYVLKNKDRAGVVLVDTRGASDYRKGLIPGAVVLADRDSRTALRDVSGRILPVKTLEKILGDAGLTPGMEIITYGSRGDTNPHLVFWILEHFGVEKAKVYHGGFDDWTAAKHPVTNEPRKLPAAQFTAKVRADVMATTDYVKKNLQNKDIQFVDTRTAREYRGEDIRALRGGYIDAVNHVNIPFEQMWKDPDTARKLADKTVKDNEGMALKDMAALRELYKGLDPNKEVLAYCQTGIRSTQTYAVLRDMGFKKVRNYDDSWIVWGSDEGLPAKNVTWFDFVRVNAAMTRLEALEKQVGEMAAKK